MEDTPVLKWTLAALGVIVACFCLGYFVLGPSPRSQQAQQASGVQVAAAPDNNTTIPPSLRPRPTAKPALIIEDQTSEYEAKLKKLEEEKRKAEEARLKAEEALRQKELEAASAPPVPTDASPEPSPTPAVLPTPPGSLEESGNGNESPTTAPPPDIKPATPDVVSPPTPTPKPATPKPATPEPKSVTGTTYKVQLTGYSTREAANTVAAELRGRGYSTLIVSEESGGKSTFRVQVGAYKSKATADSTLKELQANGYDATIRE